MGKKNNTNKSQVQLKLWMEQGQNEHKHWSSGRGKEKFGKVCVCEENVSEKAISAKRFHEKMPGF